MRGLRTLRIECVVLGPVLGGSGGCSAKGGNAKGREYTGCPARRGLVVLGVAYLRHVIGNFCSVAIMHTPPRPYPPPPPPVPPPPQARDPIPQLKAFMLKNGLATEADLKEIHDKVGDLVIW